MSKPTSPLEVYQAIIDELVSRVRLGGSSSHVAVSRIYSNAPDHARFNTFIGSLTDDQRQVLSEMLMEERHGAIHDVLAT